MVVRVLVTVIAAAWVVSPTPSAQTLATHATPPAASRGCTTAYAIDHDCDGYGVGHGFVYGPDADDDDPTVNTTATVLAKYGDVATYLATVRHLAPLGTWYLATTGNDATCAKNDPTRPCKTYATARTKIASGDALMIRGGTYTEANKPFSFPSVSGTPDHPTVVMAYPGEDVTLRRTADGSDPWGMYLNANDAIVDGIFLTTANPNHGKGIDLTKGAALANVTIRHSEISNFYTNIFGCFGGHDLHVEGNVLHDAKSEHNVYTCNNNGNTGPQVATVLADNVMYGAQWNNIHLNTNRCDGCVIERNTLWSSNETGSGNANIAIQSGFSGGRIDSNLLFNYSGYGLLLNTYNDGQPGIGVPGDINHNTIANNTLVDTARDRAGHNFTGQCFASVTAQNTSTVTTVDLGHNDYLNNVLVHANSGSPNCGALVAYTQRNAGDAAWWTTDRYEHNVIYAADGAAPLSIAPPGKTIASGKQTWDQFAAAVAAFVGNTQTDPTLAHYAAGDYATPLRFNLTLLSGSPAIATGTSGPAVPLIDVRRTPRGTPPARGAYEFP